jgi:serine/threonine-protein kinase
MTDLRDELQASLGQAYAIERELGGGGMSRVFVAEEASLGRRVVVKVLPAELSGAVSLARFRREISLAARLQHPHIVPLLAAGDVGGLPYYTMPLVDGESLRARLERGELPIGDAIAILRDVAKALEYAHGKGVVHRDIKPDNVLLAGRSAMITDFGVAKAISDATANGSFTSVGIALGTPAYMAPEQAAADPATDSRADIYAFGAMAYEMLAGHAPFAGRSAQSVLAAHATETPPLIAALRPATPAPLAALVMRCLEKRPGDRPQSATAIVQSLESIPTSGAPEATITPAATESTRHPSRRRALVAAGLVAIIVMVFLAAIPRWRGKTAVDAALRSIAVLPFENTSGDTAFDYLEDGITDHVRDALERMPALTVKARSSSRQLKGRDAIEVGTKLRVGAVLQGAVSGSSSRLHVTAELVRASDGNTVWGSTFDGPPSQLAGIQDTIVRAIAARLHLTESNASSDRNAATAERGTADADAYYSFLRGRLAADRLDWTKASALFRDAVARDPRFAKAHALLAVAYANTPTLGRESVDSMNALSRVSAKRALALDSTAVEAYVAESYALVNEMRLADAITPLESAFRMDSTNTDVLFAYGIGLAQIGRLGEGLSLLRRARERDPLSSTVVGVVGYVVGLMRQYDSAIAITKLVREIDPTNVLVRQGLGFQFAFNGMPDSSLAEFETAFRLNPVLFGGRSNLVFGYAAAGRWNDAARQRAMLERETGGNSPHYHRMIVDLAFGHYDAAMTALEQGVAAREALFGIPSIPCDPLFDPLKSSPRFAALMQRLGAHACPAQGKWPIGKAPG